MTFLAPWFFWSLLALLPLAASYFIKTRPRRRATNTWFLWQGILHEHQASSLFRKMRNVLSLLLMALAFAAAVLALTRPVPVNQASTDLLIVLDTSVSMQALADGKPLVEQARDRITGWIDALGGGRRAAFATAAGSLDWKVHLTSNTRVLREAVAGAVAGSEALGRPAIDALASLAAAARAGGPSQSVRILFVTDTCSPARGLDIPGVETVVVGPPGANLGITAADLRWRGDGQASLMVEISSSHPEPRQVECEIRNPLDGAVARVIAASVPAMGSVIEVIDLEDVEPGLWLAALSHGDGFTADDQMWIGLDAPRPIGVRIVAENRFFFDRCARAFAGARGLLAPDDNATAFALSDGTATDARAQLVFHPRGNGPFWSGAGEPMPGPVVPVVKEKNHPLIAHWEPEAMRYSGARPITPAPGAVVLVADEGGTPLLFTARDGDRVGVVANWDPALDDYFLSPWFPVLVHDAAAFLSGRDDLPPSAVSTGSRLAIPGRDGQPAAFQVGADGGRRPLPVVDNHVTLAESGGYWIGRGEEAWPVGAGPMDRAESGLVPPPPATAAPGIPTGWPMAAWFLVGAIALLAAEEMLYHRRKVG